MDIFFPLLSRVGPKQALVEWLNKISTLLILYCSYFELHLQINPLWTPCWQGSHKRLESDRVSKHHETSEYLLVRWLEHREFFQHGGKKENTAFHFWCCLQIHFESDKIVVKGGDTLFFTNHLYFHSCNFLLRYQHENRR